MKLGPEFITRGDLILTHKQTKCLPRGDCFLMLGLLTLGCLKRTPASSSGSWCAEADEEKWRAAAAVGGAGVLGLSADRASCLSYMMRR